MEKPDPMYVYIETTGDDLSLIKNVADSVEELAMMSHTTKASILSAITHFKSGKRKKSKFEKVLINPDGEPPHYSKSVKYDVMKDCEMILEKVKCDEVSKLIGVSKTTIFSAIKNNNGMCEGYQLKSIMIYKFNGSNRNDTANSTCLNCEMRVKYGDCHSFCPSYLKFKRDIEKDKERIRKQKQADMFGYKDPFRYPRRTEIERMDKRWKNK